MEHEHEVWERAHQQASNYLRRHGDHWTQTHRDDLVQEATIAAWRWAQAPHDSRRFWAAVRTITRRIRCRARWNARRLRTNHPELPARPVEFEPEERRLLIAGRRVPLHRARAFLQEALAELLPIDRQLLLGLHEGFCCAELAERFRRSESCVKTRIHRARRRVRIAMETCVRAAGSLEP